VFFLFNLVLGVLVKGGGCSPAAM